MLDRIKELKVRISTDRLNSTNVVLLTLVVLPNVAVCSIEKLLILVELVLEEGLSAGGTRPRLWAQLDRASEGITNQPVTTEFCAANHGTRPSR